MLGARFPILLLAFLALAPAAAPDTADPIDRAFTRLYNFDFQGAHAILNEYIAGHPADALAYAARAATDLFYELDRLAILESEFFIDDRRITEKKKLRPDLQVRNRFLQAISDARSRAQSTLAKAPDDYHSMLALCTTEGLLLDYTALVEKKHLGSLSLAKRNNTCAQQLLKVHPEAHDAYLTTGFTEYLVGSLPFYVRWFIRFDEVKGSKDQGIRNLQLVAESGQYLKSFAKVLLAIACLREKQPLESKRLLSELARAYPENPLFHKELDKIPALLNTGTTDGHR